MKPLVIVGAGGHGRVVSEMAGRPIAGFIDNASVGKVNAIPVLGTDRLLSDQSFLSAHDFVVALGDQQDRRHYAKLLSGRLATIIHPSAIVSPSAIIGEGSVLVAGSIINANANIGAFCILNTGCSIDHDCDLADGVQVCPGARLAGRIFCGEDAFIGTGAVVIPGVHIGARTVIGAGAVVVRDVASYLTAYGNPARPAATVVKLRTA